MPTQRTVTDSRLNNILVCLTSTITLLNEVNDAFGTSFIKAISNTTLSLVTAVQNVKRNKEQCVQLMENIHQILHAIINLHLKPDTVGRLPPAMLDHVGNFTKTLHKIHTFVEAQQDGNRLTHFFRQSEMNTLCKGCFEGLEEAVKFFTVEAGFHLAESIAEWQQTTQKMHQELLELVANLSDGSTSDTVSSIYPSTAGSQTSSTSFSLLPAQPKIFHGRQSELEEIIINLTQQSARIAILGAGGIGKTSLAKAALHHVDIVPKYEQRFFIAADSATTSIELAALIGSHLKLKPGNNLTKPVVQHLSRGPTCLLVLDNLETPWEPLESRGAVEEFLSLLTEISHLALIITMRGAERPAKVRWTHPFLEPLQPLSYDAAQKTFIEIADDCHDSKDIDKLLQLTDNMPLAVDLIAHLVDYAGSSSVLARWETEKTAMLSVGHDKGASLDASIAMSLASPRMASHPGAKELLSLLSILPDGLSDVELNHCNLPIKDILACRAILLQISMAYRNNKNRLKSLAPIREHIKNLYPPSPLLFHPLCQYFRSLLHIYKKYEGLHQNYTGIQQIASNFGNLQQVLLLELHPNNPDIIDAINCALSLNSYAYNTGHGFITLMNHIPALFPQPSDHRLEVVYAIEMLKLIDPSLISNQKLLIDGAMAHLRHCNDPALESDFYHSVGVYYAYFSDRPTSVKFCEQALSSARLCKDSMRQANALNQIARLKSRLRDLSAAKTGAYEAQQMAHMSGNLSTQAFVLTTEMSCLVHMGNLPRAALLGHRARELVQLCGLEGGPIDDGIMLDLAQIHMLKSEYQEARNIYVQLQNKSDPQQKYFNAFTLMNIAKVNMMLDTDPFDVQKNLENAKTTFGTLGFTGGLNACDVMLADLSLRDGKGSIAEKVLQNYSKDGRSSSLKAYCLERLADVGCWTLTGINWPYTWTVIYLAFAHQGKRKLDLYNALRLLGDISLSQGDEQTAHNLFVVALEKFAYMDIHRSRADCMLRLGDIAKNRGDLIKAAELWKEARRLFERSLQVKDMAQIDTRLASINENMPGIQQEALVQLTGLRAPLDEVYNVSDKPDDTASAILEETPRVTA
ncbi:hypothetical protein C8R44DRAFT_725932 [Mycena epipterygia]|nr:hypothetical protein C8R44DRAFT_725932 [Mycena epipterygia]